MSIFLLIYIKFPEILEQYHQARDAEKQISQEKCHRDDEIRRLTEERERDRAKLRSKDKEIERLQSLLKESSLHATLNPIQGAQDQTKKVCLPILYK